MSKLKERALIEWLKDYKAEPLEVAVPILEAEILLEALAFNVVAQMPQLDEADNEILNEVRESFKDSGALKQFQDQSGELEDMVKDIAVSRAISKRIESCSKFIGTKNHVKKYTKSFEKLAAEFLMGVEPFDWAKRLVMFQAVAEKEGLDDLSLESATDLIENSTVVLNHLKSQFEINTVYVDDPRSAVYQEFIERIANMFEANAAQVASGEVYQFKVSLDNAPHPIWRRIQIPADASFEDLHDEIQSAMGWWNSHLHEFYVGKGKREERTRIGMVSDEYALWDEGEVLDEAEQKLCDWLVEPKSKIFYTYDFGDGWDHTIVFEKILERDRDEDYPKYVTGKGNCPPEDCGGVWGYEELLQLKARSDKGEDLDEHEQERLDWYRDQL